MKVAWQVIGSTATSTTPMPTTRGKYAFSTCYNSEKGVCSPK